MFRFIKKLIAVVIVLLFIFAALTGYGMLKLEPDEDLPVCNLNDYVVVTQSGKNGEGVISMTLDTERIITDYSEYMDSDGLSKMPDWVQRATEPLSLENTVRTLLNGVALDEVISTKAFGLVLSKESGLSNGDEIIVQWEEAPANIGALKLILPINFEHTPFSYTIANLTVPASQN